MELPSRFTVPNKPLLSSALDQAEGPSLMLDYAYQRQLERFQNVRRAMVDVVTKEKRLELQGAWCRRRSPDTRMQARQALAVNREDLARLALECRHNLQGDMTTFQQQIEHLFAQQEKFVQLEQRPSARVETFRTQRDQTKAPYGAREAQVKIREAATGLSEEMGDLSLAVRWAQDKVRAMQARAQAMDQLIEQGTLAEIGQPGPGGARVDHQLAQLSSQFSIDTQLVALKLRMQLTSGQQGQHHAQLPIGQ